MGAAGRQRQRAAGRQAEQRPARVERVQERVQVVLVGILGFIPGITTDFDDLSFAGHHSGAELIGIFQVSVLHNLVHLGLGLVGVVLARTVQGARLFLLGGGATYLVIWLYGLFIDKESGLNFVPLNTADDWLHLATGSDYRHQFLTSLAWSTSEAQFGKVSVPPGRTTSPLVVNGERVYYPLDDDRPLAVTVMATGEGLFARSGESIFVPAGAALASPRPVPDLGPNVKIFDPSMSTSTIQATAVAPRPGRIELS